MEDIHSYYDVVEETKQAIEQTDLMSRAEKDLISIFGFGHMADGDIHINICVEGHENRELYQRVNNFVDPFVMEFIRKKNGSISGEHGVGQ